MSNIILRKKSVKSLFSYTLPFSLGLIALVAIQLAGCNDNPTRVGDNYLPQNVEFKTVDLPLSEITILSGIAGISNTSNESNDAMLVGMAPDGTIAHSLMTPSSYSTRLQSISAGDIQSVELRLRTFNYRYGDTASRRVGFDVASMEGVFGSTAQWNDDLVNRISAGTGLGQYNDNYPDSSFISIPLDKELAAEYLNSYYRLDTVVRSAGDTTIETVVLRTLALRALQGGSMVASFLGSTISSLPDSVKPTLRVTLADTVVNLTMAVTNWITRLPSAVETGQNKIVVAGGAPIRTLIKFRLDSIPSGAIIHRAELTLHVIPESQSAGTTGVTTRVIAYVAGSDPLGTENYLATFPNDLGKIFLRGARPAKDENSFEDYFTFNGLGVTLTQWLRAERGFGNTGLAIPNNGLLLSLDRTIPSLESGTVDRLAFYGPDAPEGLRPQLRIVYSTQVNA